MSDDEFLDELWRRISTGAVRCELYRQGEGYAQITFRTHDNYQFDALAMPKAIRQGV